MFTPVSSNSMPGRFYVCIAKKRLLLLLVALPCFLLSQVTWDNVGPGGGSDLHFLAVQPDNAEVIYAGGDIEGIFKTTDGGDTWNSANTGLPHTNAHQMIGRHYWDQYGLWLSMKVLGTPGDSTTFSGGLFMSTDFGDTWTDILEHSRVIDVQLHPIRDGVLLAAGQQWWKYDNTGKGGALYLSNDNGATWDVISQEVAHTFFNGAQFNPHEPQEVYAVTAGGGMWRSSNVPVSVGDETDLPTRFTVSQNYPNPFNPVTTFSYSLPSVQNVTLEIYDLTGRSIARIYKPSQSPGSHSIRWDASGHASGVYIYKIMAKSKVYQGKCVLLK